MQRTTVISILFISLTACGRTQMGSPVFASGIPAAQDEIETQILEPQTEVTSLAEDDQPILQLMKAGAAPTYFAVDAGTTQLAHDVAKTWQGCASSALVKGGYQSDSKCGRAYLQPKFDSQLEKKFFLCAERGASKAGLARPNHVYVNHDGSYNDRDARNTTRLSMHAYARALDIAAFLLYDGADKVSRISTNVRNYKGVTKSFYDEFRQCWKEAMPASCSPGKTEWKGSIGIPSSALGGNSLHNDHIHLSYALCAG